MNPVIEEREERITTADIAGKDAVQRREEEHGFLPNEFAQDLRARWDQIQTGFVDEPRTAVQQADELVAMTIKRIAETFAEERNSLERQWDRGDNVSTEDLRVGLQKYRSFFQRLLNV